MNAEARKRPTRIHDLSASDRASIAALIARKTQQVGDCLEWIGAKGNQGYGVVPVHEGEILRSTSAHRAAWIIANGAIPGRLVIDHLCHNRACVLVSHLELVTSMENSARGDWSRTECLRGHPLSGSNLRTYVSPKTGYVSRICRECNRSRDRASRANARAASDLR